MVTSPLRSAQFPCDGALGHTSVVVMLAVVLMGVASPVGANEEQRFRQASLPVILEINFPGAAITGGLRQGRARAAVEVGADGSALDILILWASHPIFAETLLSTLREKTYLPATIDGIPIASRYQLSYRFTPRHEVWINVNDALAEKARIPGHDLDPGVHLESALERPIEFVTAPEFSIPKTNWAMGAFASARPILVSFYVTADGTLRMPHVHTLIPPKFVQPIIDGLRLARCTPPDFGERRDPVLVARNITLPIPELP